VVAYLTASGLSPGMWLQRLYDLTPSAERASTDFVFILDDGTRWTSHYYRHRICRAQGGPFLNTMNDTPGNTVVNRLWGFNTQRRSGHSEISKKRAWTIRAATPAEVVEHGQWRISRSSLDMPLAYLEWSMSDRACVTIACM
jgi:hypothetical protein